MSIAIHTSALTLSYGNTRVLDGIDLSVPEGATFALLGPNGAGKTTLVRILSTLIAPTSGAASIAGFDLASQAHQVRSAISLTGQYAAVDEFLTGEENMRLMTRLWKLGGREGTRRGQELLERFDLAKVARRPVKHYSGGMRRKLDLALSLVARPKVLFLDEPTTGLDPRSRLAMWDTVRELAASGVTVFLTTQYLEEADRLATSIVMIDHGRVIASGSPEQLKRNLTANRVSLLFESEAMYRKALAALGPRALHPDASPLTLQVETGAGADGIRHLLNDLAAADIRIERMSILEPTLDDVFMNLTGDTPAPNHMERAA